jgi:DNA-binding SARP family transcriptional activator
MRPAALLSPRPGDDSRPAARDGQAERSVQVTIELCGTLRVEVDGRRLEDGVPGRQGRLILAYLVLHRDRPVSRDELINVLWQRDPPAAPGPALSTLLARLRRVLGNELLAGRTHLSLRLPDDAWIDVEVASRRAAEAEAALAAADPARAHELARAAFELLERSLLAEFEAPWIDERRRELAELSSEVLDTMARAALELGPAEVATAERAASLLIEREPYRESGYALLMQAHACRGDVAQAVCVFERLRHLLREELGVSPAAAVLALHERLVRHGEAPAAVPAGPQRDPAVPLPSLLARSEQRTLVGRTEALDRLRERWRRTPEGDGALVLVTGDAGIGKTRLVSRLAAEAHASGATVLYGRTDEDTVVPYQPFVEAMRHLARHSHELDQQPALAAHRGELARLVPEITGTAEDQPDDAQESQRYRLFEAVVALLTHAANRAPVLVLVEDLHWADKPTALLLRQVVREAEGQPLMVVGTYRDAEISESDPLARVVADLRREHTVQRIRLEGLDDRETQELISARAQVTPSTAFSQGICARTAGNPFFIEETIRDLGESPSDNMLRVPEGVKEVIARRIERLSPTTAEVLTTAAVLGADFRLEALQAVTPDPAVDLLTALEEGLSAGLLIEHPEGVDRFAFRHALVRETLHERPAASRRRRLHLGAATALEAARERLGVQAAELAWHFWQASQVGGAEKAVLYSEEAARATLGSRAYEAAAEHYERALRALELAAPGDAAARCDRLLGLGGARSQGGEPGARPVFEQAAELARELGAPEQLARAALGASGRCYAPVAVDHASIRLLSEALDRLASTDTALRSRVMGRLAESTSLAEPAGRATEVAADALAMARRAGDAGATAAALMSLHTTLLHAEHAEQRERIAAQAHDAAIAAGARELAALADHWILYDLFELGRLDEVDRRQAELDQLAHELQQPLFGHSALAWRCVRAQLAGRFDESERLARESLRLAERAGAADAQRHFTAQLFALRRDQGRLGELLPEIARLAADENGSLLWRAALPLALLAAGERDHARDAFERVAGNQVPETMMWLAVTGLLAETAAALGDADRAGVYYDGLRPHADRFIQAGFAGNLGCTHRILGRLALLRSDPVAARDHLQAALERHVALGARPLSARTQCELAGALRAIGGPAERRRAVQLVTEARATADSLGLEQIAAAHPPAA